MEQAITVIKNDFVMRKKRLMMKQHIMVMKKHLMENEFASEKSLVMAKKRFDH